LGHGVVTLTIKYTFLSSHAMVGTGSLRGRDKCKLLTTYLCSSKSQIAFNASESESEKQLFKML